jgi:stage II sporulation protein D
MNFRKSAIPAGIVFLTTLAVFLAFRAVLPWHRHAPGMNKAVTVRVLVSDDTRELRLTSRGPCRILDAVSGAVIAKGLTLNGEALPGQGRRLMIIPEGEGANVFFLRSSAYKGTIEIVPSDGLDRVIEHIPLEEYLKGVVPREASPLWPFESLKAQAVASRSYVLSEMSKRRDRDYDVRDDTLSQVYGGIKAERWRTDLAVKATAGKILTYAGKVLPAYFHSCCGGHTEDSAVLWGKSLSPLEGKRCGYCRISPHFRWTAGISAKIIAEKLKAAGIEIGAINDIKSGLRDRSGRLEYVSVKSGNKWKEIASGDFIKAIGAKNIKSAKFYVRKYPLYYRFNGFGWGHGAGMCQWGAFGMALRWKSMKNILEFYYPGAEISDINDADILPL